MAPIEVIPSHVLNGWSDVDVVGPAVLVGEVVDAAGAVVVGDVVDDVVADVSVDTVDDAVPWSPDAHPAAMTTIAMQAETTGRFMARWCAPSAGNARDTGPSATPSRTCQAVHVERSLGDGLFRCAVVVRR